MWSDQKFFLLNFFFFSISFHSFKFYLYVPSYHGCLPHGQKDIRQRKCWLNQKGRQLIEKPYQPSYLYIICVGSRYIVSVLGLFPPSVVKTMPHCFLLHLFFFKAGVYSRISSVSAMHGIAQFVLCDFSQQHFFLFSTFILKKNYLRILEVLFLLYNFSSLVKILAKLFCSLKCLWVNKIYGNQLWLKRK